MEETYSIGIWVCAIFFFFLFSCRFQVTCSAFRVSGWRKENGWRARKGNEETKTKRGNTNSNKKPFDFFLSSLNPLLGKLFSSIGPPPSSRRAACLSGFSSLPNPKSNIPQFNSSNSNTLITSSSPTSSSSCSKIQSRVDVLHQAPPQNRRDIRCDTPTANTSSHASPEPGQTKPWRCREVFLCVWSKKGRTGAGSSRTGDRRQQTGMKRLRPRWA